MHDEIFTIFLQDILNHMKVKVTSDKIMEFKLG